MQPQSIDGLCLKFCPPNHLLKFKQGVSTYSHIHFLMTPLPYPSNTALNSVYRAPIKLQPLHLDCSHHELAFAKKEFVWDHKMGVIFGSLVLEFRLIRLRFLSGSHVTLLFMSAKTCKIRPICSVLSRQPFVLGSSPVICILDPVKQPAQLLFFTGPNVQRGYQIL